LRDFDLGVPCIRSVPLAEISESLFGVAEPDETEPNEPLPDNRLAERGGIWIAEGILCR
jgi:hypothetical protein